MNERSDAVAAGEARVPTERGDVAREEAAGENVELLPQEMLGELRGRWERIQIGFVDHPREAVGEAHDLVGQAVERLTESFTRQRDTLEGAWHRGGDVSTEELRQALQRYRSFFNRLLST